MATGRTVPKFVRCYVDGYDMSGYSRTIGPLKWEYEEADLTVQMSDAMMGFMSNLPSISPGILNGVFDNTATSGLHVIGSAVAASRIITVPIGIQAAPAQGDPCFNGQFVQAGYHGEIVGPSVYAQVPFGEWDVLSPLNYDQPWGVVLDPMSAQTGANTAVGIDDNGGASTAGGYMIYHVSAGNGTATISIDDAATNTNPNFGALASATSGELDMSSVQKGIVQLGVTATVRQFLRWQISLNTATTVTFALAFVRGN